MRIFDRDEGPVDVWPVTWPQFQSYTGHTTLEGARRTAVLMRDAGDLIANDREDGVRLTRRCCIEGVKFDALCIRADRASTPWELGELARRRREEVRTASSVLTL